MAIDPSIALQVRPVQLPDFMAMRANAENLRSQQMGREMQQMQLADLLRTRQRQDDTRQAFTRNYSAETGLNQKGLLADLMRVDPQAGMAFDAQIRAQQAEAKKQQLEERKTLLAMDKDKLGMMLDQNKMIANVAQGIQASSNPEVAYRQARQMLIGQNPEMAQSIPEAYDPAFVQMAGARGIEAKDQIESILKEKTFAETKRANLAAEGFKRQEVGIAGARLGLEKERLGVEKAKTAMEVAKTRQELGEKALQKEGTAASIQTTIDSAKRLLDHPGLSGTVGFSTGMRFLPGTKEADFNAELETFRSQTFLPMVQALKGMGALSENEGKKLTDAVGALDRNMSEKSFKASLKRVMGELQDRMKRTQGVSVPVEPERSAPMAQPKAQPTNAPLTTGARLF
jgi:hypothetical protein